MKPRLLAASPIPPWPLDNGLALRVYHLLARLTSEWDISLVYPSSEGTPDPNLMGLGLRDIVPVPVDSLWTYAPWQYDTRPVRKAANELLEAGMDGALLWSGTEYLAMEDAAFPPTVVDRVDSSTLTLWRQLRATPGVRGKAHQVRELVTSARYERAIGRVARRILTVSPVDAAWLRRVTGRDLVTVHGNGVEMERTTETPEDPSPLVVFTGAMNYAPNYQAVFHFADQVWPRIRQAVPEAAFAVVGRDPTPEVKALADIPGIVVTGRVESVQAMLGRAWVAVAPMVSGAGIKNKILEAWVCGTPVVMTSVGAAGLRMEGSEDLIADEPAEFADVVVELLTNAERRRYYGSRGLETARDFYSWDGAARSLSDMLHEAVGVPGGSAEDRLVPGRTGAIL